MVRPNREGKSDEAHQLRSHHFRAPPWRASPWAWSPSASVLPQTAFAAFHLMEIEQVVGGVAGDTTAQAVQLTHADSPVDKERPRRQRRARRPRRGGSELVIYRRLAPNPGFTTGCRRILLVTPAMAAKPRPQWLARTRWRRSRPRISPRASPTFESVVGQAGLVAGDLLGRRRVHRGRDDGDWSARRGRHRQRRRRQSRPSRGALPSAGVAGAALFTPACATASGRRARLDYAVTARRAAVLVNNGQASFTVTAPDALGPRRCSGYVEVPALAGVLGLWASWPRVPAPAPTRESLARSRSDADRVAGTAARRVRPSRRRAPRSRRRSRARARAG